MSKKTMRISLALVAVMSLSAQALAEVVSINDLTPYDNSIRDNGFWSTTNHPLVSVSRESSDSAIMTVQTAARSELVVGKPLDSRTFDLEWSEPVPVNCSSRGSVIIIR